MARTVTLATLRQRVQRRADIESATARFPNSEINDNINESIAELYDRIREQGGVEYYRSTYTINTTSGTSTYSLPTDFLELVSVDIVLATNSVITAKKYIETERNFFKWFPVGWVFGQPIYYRLTGGNINFIPTPQGGFQVNVNYVPTAPVLVNDSDTFDGVIGWEEYVVLDAAIKCLIKDEETDIVPVLEARKAAVWDRIQRLVSERDGGQPERVHDVYTGSGWGNE